MPNYPRLRIAATLLALPFVLVQCQPATTQAQMAPAGEQIAAAVQAAPADLRDGARVLGFDADGAWVELRSGSNDLVCLADNPGQEGWNVACYHSSLDPFMAMGRDLRAQGMDSGDIRTRRNEAADSGELAMPERPAALYVMTGDGFDSATGEAQKGFVRYVLYTPYATTETTGLASAPSGPLQPWLMFPGTAGAHVMITPPQED
jgi:hypothetical protein